MDLLETRSEASTLDESQEANTNNLLPVEEAVLEIPRPNYTSAELGQLVCYLRDMCFLCDLRDCDWNQECLSVIEKWFLENQHPVLFIFYSPDRILTGSLTIPLTPYQDATYFLREPNEIFQVTSFHDCIQYGTIHDPDESLLVLLETIYGPHFFTQDIQWSDRVRVNCLEAMDDFLIDVTDLHYKMSGLTVLPVPTLQGQTGDEFSVRRLEKVIIHWMGQIRLFLGDDTPKELLCPSDCYDFWVYREEVLHGLILQFERAEVQTVLRVLEAKQSIYIEQFNALVKECSEEVTRAVDNIRFLALLIDPCKQLEECQSIADIPRLLPEIIRLILFIQRKSQFLKDDAILDLFRSLTNHIILYCRSAIDLPEILERVPREGITLCSMSIDCCLAYKEIYEVIITEDLPMDDQVIFNPIDTFIERLHDLILICEYSDISARTAPQFGGTWGKEFERTCQEMARIFSEALAEVKEKRHLALDVTDDQWSSAVIVRFKGTLKELDEIFQNMLQSAFKYCRSIDDRIEVLCTLIQYQKRASLSECFNESIDQLYESVMQEVTSIKSFVLEERTRKRKYALSEKFSGFAYFLLAQLNRTQRLQEMAQSLVWLREETPESVRLELDILEQLLQQDIQSNYEEWKASIPEDTVQSLQRSLLVRSLSRPGLLECNVDRNLVVLLREATSFKRLQFPTPIHISQTVQKASQISLVLESVLTMSLDYNLLVTSLTDKERLLFRPLIKTCDKKITAGIYKLNWTGELADNYVGECLQLTRQCQDVLTRYKTANKRIVEVCESICGQEVLLLDTGELQELSSLEEHLVSTQRSGCCWRIGNKEERIENELLFYSKMQLSLSRRHSQRSAHRYTKPSQ